jgi:hypothetical protein
VPVLVHHFKVQNLKSTTKKKISSVVQLAGLPPETQLWFFHIYWNYMCQYWFISKVSTIFLKQEHAHLVILNNHHASMK